MDYRLWYIIIVYENHTHDILPFRRERKCSSSIEVIPDLVPELIHFCRRGHHRHLFHGQVATAHVIGSVLCDLEGQPELATRPATERGKFFAVRKKKVWPTNMGGCWYAHICKNPLRIRIVIYDHWQRCSVRTYCGLVYPGWLLGSPAYKMSFLKIVWETSACSLMWMPISGNELWSYVLTYHINIIYIIIYNNPILSQYIPTMATSWCSDNQNHQQVHRKSLGWWSTCKQ